MSAEATIQIFSVNFNHVPMLRANIELTRERNPNQPHHWHIANNGGSRTAAEIAELADYDNVSVYDGAEREPNHRVVASLQHATALNRIVHEHAGDSPILIVDPDFYIIRADGLRECLTYMGDHELDFLGCPWNPYWRFKYRFFPTVHCCFIRQQRLTATDLDWCPGTFLAHPEEAPDFVVRFRRIPLFGQLLRRLVYQIRNRTLIATDEDTGYRIQRRYASDPTIRSECFQSVFTRYQDYSRFHQYLDAILPEHLAFAPKRPGYFTTEGFKSHGLPDMDKHSFEEFMFQGKPFGFHLHRFMLQFITDRPQSVEIDQELEAILKQFPAPS